MKILQILPRFPWPLKDGGAYAYYQDAKGYRDNNCELSLAILNTSKHWVDFEQMPEQVKSLGDFHLFEINNHIKAIPALKNLLFSNESYHAIRFYNKEFENLLVKLCSEKSFDIIVFESVYMAPYIHAIRKVTKAKCVLKQYNVEANVWDSYAQLESNLLKKKYLQIQVNRLRKFEDNNIHYFDGLVCVTAEDRDVFLAKSFNKPMHVSAVGISINPSIPANIQVEAHSVFHLGSMDWMPNQHAVEWFINEVWPIVVNQQPALKLYIAGRNLPDYFNKYQKTGSIEIIGEVENSETFILSKQIMIVPLFSGSGIRVKILEGMAYGKCIVSTSLGCQGIDVKNGEELIIADSVESFADAVLLLASNSEWREKLSLNAQNKVKEKYDNNQLTKNKLTYYQSLIK